MHLIRENRFELVLLAPARERAVDRLLVVSGYATAVLADRHVAALTKLGLKVDVELVVGMAGVSGIERAHHLAFQKLAREGTGCGRFSCGYAAEGKPIHAKVYCWMKGDEPVVAFNGSANYTQTGFGGVQLETMDETDAGQAHRLFLDARDGAVDCLDGEAERMVVPTKRHRAPAARESVELDLLAGTREGARSGINWGQREGRDGNQAYIQIPAEVARSGFFPERGVEFTVITDDDESFLMARRQDGGKGLETTKSNALLGEYLRRRMGLPTGTFVTEEHLRGYGRTSVTVSKVDTGTYLLDFSAGDG